MILFVVYLVFMVCVAMFSLSWKSPAKNTLDAHFVVESRLLKPQGTPRTFDPTTVANTYLVESRQKFQYQPFLGSVLLGGEHVLLPEGLVWKDGVLQKSDAKKEAKH